MSNTMNIEIIPDDTEFPSTKVIVNRREQEKITRYYCIQTEDDEELKKPLQNCSDQNDEKCIQLRFIVEYLLHI
jgi:hypothetical protein